jgi:hypothetical protein
MSRTGLLMHNRKEGSEVVGSLYINGVREAGRKLVASVLKRLIPEKLLILNL